MYQHIEKGISLIKKMGFVPISWLSGILSAFEKHPKTLKWLIFISSAFMGLSNKNTIEIFIKSLFR